MGIVCGFLGAITFLLYAISKTLDGIYEQLKIMGYDECDCNDK